MKGKLWIAYWVLSLTAIGIGIVTDNFAATMGFAIAAAGAGWTAFLME